MPTHQFGCAGSTCKHSAPAQGPQLDHLAQRSFVERGVNVLRIASTPGKSLLGSDMPTLAEKKPPIGEAARWTARAIELSRCCWTGGSESFDYAERGPAGT